MTTTDATLVQLEEYQRDPAWGAMSHPAREEIAAGSPPWKDHIYVAFWDTKNEAYGFLHWNSSPKINGSQSDTRSTSVCIFNLRRVGTSTGSIRVIPASRLASRGRCRQASVPERSSGLRRSV